MKTPNKIIKHKLDLLELATFTVKSHLQSFMFARIYLLPLKIFLDSVDLAKNYYIEKQNKREDIEKENDEYILP